MKLTSKRLRSIIAETLVEAWNPSDASADEYFEHLDAAVRSCQRARELMPMNMGYNELPKIIDGLMSIRKQALSYRRSRKNDPRHAKKDFP